MILNGWRSFKKEPPEEYYTVLFAYIYGNGNSGYGVGSFYKGEWDIDWTDDFPSKEDILFWMPFPEIIKGKMRVDWQKLRKEY